MKSIFLGVLCVFAPAWVLAGDLEVTIVAPAGKTLASGVLIVDGRSQPLADGGKQSLPGLPDKRLSVTVDALVGGKGGGRYLGVSEVETVPGKAIAVTVKVQPLTDVDVFCMGCHPTRGKSAKPNVIYRDIHVSGKEITEPRYLAQVKLHNEKVAQQLKDKTSNPPLTIPLEERVVKVGGKEVKKIFYTCESCHTTHLKTPWSKYMRASYASPSTLCVGCHF